MSVFSNPFRLSLLILSLHFAWLGEDSLTLARDNTTALPPDIPKQSRLAPPAVEVRVHKAGDVLFTVSNDGHFAYQEYPNTNEIDPETGLPSPGCEYPGESGIWYLYTGALWLGGVVGSDTLVTTGKDGWVRVREFYPDDGATSSIMKRSTIPNSPNYSPDAISEEDFVATFYDTLTSPLYVAPDPFQNRPHRPLGVRVTQESYAWSAAGVDNFVIVRERVVNIGPNVLQGLTAGLYFDSDIGHTQTRNWFADDISGSIDVSQELDVPNAIAAWSADNDGDPAASAFNARSPLAAFGVTFLASSAVRAQTFNWWVSCGDPVLDWGPTLQTNHHPLGTGGLGEPSGDPNKYFYMNNAERDYDQIEAVLDHSGEGWLPPLSPTWIAHLYNVADGYDTRFLLSQHLGDLVPGDSTEFVFVVVLGDNLHKSTDNFQSHFSADNPLPYYNGLDFTGLKSGFHQAKVRYQLALEPLSGDANLDYVVNISDAVYLIKFIFSEGAPPSKRQIADVNADCQINLIDAVYLISFVFAGGPFPQLGCATK